VVDENTVRIGLTGGIGSGKSTVSALLQRFGAAVVDTDRIARELTGPGGQALETIAATFGPDAIDSEGALDRSRMRQLVFSNVSSRKRLEAILHPLIAAEAERQACASKANVTVFDVPLLVESGRWPRRVHQVWVVDCSEITQISRVIARSGWSEQTVRDVIAQQATRLQRCTRADAVIHNDGINVPELSERLHRLWRSCLPPGTTGTDSSDRDS
jgi:dephospho-CoA kinase